MCKNQLKLWRMDTHLAHVECVCEVDGQVGLGNYEDDSCSHKPTHCLRKTKDTLSPLSIFQVHAAISENTLTLCIHTQY